MKINVLSIAFILLINLYYVKSDLSCPAQTHRYLEEFPPEDPTGEGSGEAEGSGEPGFEPEPEPEPPTCKIDSFPILYVSLSLNP